MCHTHKAKLSLQNCTLVFFIMYVLIWDTRTILSDYVLYTFVLFISALYITVHSFIVFSFMHGHRYCWTGHLLRAFWSIYHLDYSLTSKRKKKTKKKQGEQMDHYGPIWTVTMTTGFFFLE